MMKPSSAWEHKSLMSFSDYLNSLKIKIYNFFFLKIMYLAGPHDRPPVMY